MKKHAAKPPKTSAQRMRRLIWLDIAVGAVVVAVVATSIWAGTRHTATDECDDVGNEHTLQVADDIFSTDRLVVERCDIIKIVNSGAEDYELMFGTRDKHVNYPGFQMQLIRPNEYITLDAVQTGQYRLHDHLRNQAQVILDIQE